MLVMRQIAKSDVRGNHLVLMSHIISLEFKYLNEFTPPPLSSLFLQAFSSLLLHHTSSTIPDCFWFQLKLDYRGGMWLREVQRVVW
jgi:hypothetical protein